ncbi:hypothetical protein J7T55_010776 [Diaporthe amygdali]|uniref:uncharacterized protein n=1 Tax=Phomopsis amygdali TaxID=1214568 RepID=UPI0022FE2F0C|nr:uncharacterized protein J7T55_010776 [Diaporthe amygdali]KAJ0114387.1 hypothetical protein J7T55_010776 [Diaporthe amygdali]
MALSLATGDVCFYCIVMLDLLGNSDPTALQDKIASKRVKIRAHVPRLAVKRSSLTVLGVQVGKAQDFEVNLWIKLQTLILSALRDQGYHQSRGFPVNAYQLRVMAPAGALRFYRYGGMAGAAAS